jgi:hypothetical protein
MLSSFVVTAIVVISAFLFFITALVTLTTLSS